MIATKINHKRISRIAEILKCIAHPVRLDIIQLLVEHEYLSVSEIQEKLGCECEQSMLSHHLIKLKDKGILTSVKDGKFARYHLLDQNLSKLFECMENCNL